MARYRRIRLLTFLVLLSPARLAQALADGEVIGSFGGGDGIATWPTSSDSFRLAALATSDELLIGVGDYEEGDDPPVHLAWQSVDRNGELRSDHRCSDQTADWIPFGVSSAGSASLVDSTGNLVVGGFATLQGSTSQRRPLIVRYRLDIAGCELDETFSGSGFEIFDNVTWCDTESCSIVGLVEIRPLTGAVTAPRLVALVRSTVNVLVARYFLLGLTSSGAIDGDFGDDGWHEVIRVGNASLGPYSALAVGQSGALELLVSYFDPDEAIDLDVALFRVTAAGQGQSQSGLALDDDFDEEPYQIAVAPDGDRVASYLSGTESITRWTQDAVTGEQFEGPWGQRVGPAPIALQGDHKILDVSADANTPEAFFVARGLASFGTATPFDQDPTFGGDGFGYQAISADEFGLDSWKVAALAIWHGRPIVAGTGRFGSRDAGFLVALENQYVFADDFEGGTRASWSASVP